MANEELKKVLAHNVCRFRHKNGLTQAQLAELAKRDVSAIAHIERGDRMMGVELLVSLAEIFSVSVDTLVQEEGTAPRLGSICSMLNGQSDVALAHLEPIVRAWLSEYGDPKPARRKRQHR